MDIGYCWVCGVATIKQDGSFPKHPQLRHSFNNEILFLCFFVFLVCCFVWNIFFFIHFVQSTYIQDTNVLNNNPSCISCACSCKRPCHMNPYCFPFLYFIWRCVEVVFHYFVFAHVYVHVSRTCLFISFFFVVLLHYSC